MKKWISKNHKAFQVGKDFKRSFSSALYGKWSLDKMIFVRWHLKRLQWLLRSMKLSCLLPSPCSSLWRKSPYCLCSHFLKHAGSLCLLIAFHWESAKKKGWMKKERRWHKFSTDKISTRIMKFLERLEYRTLLFWGWICAFSP